MRSKCFFILLLPFILTLTSCYGGENTIEEIAPSILYYYEKGENEKYKVTTMVPPVRKEKRVVLTTEETLLKDIKTKLNAQYFREIKDGQLRIVIINENLAKEQGIKDIVTGLYMDTAISDRIYLGIVNGDLKRLLNSNNSADYLIYRQFKHNQTKGELQVVDLHMYLKAANSRFGDPYVPLFSMVENELHYTGIGLMKDYKMIHELTIEESRMFDLLKSQVKYHDVLSLETLQVNLGLVNSDIDIKMNAEEKRIKISMRLNGIINEYQGDKDLTNPIEQKELRNNIKNEIQDKMAKLLETFQSKKVDPLYLGLFSKKFFSQDYKDDEWREEWPKYDINMDLDLKIKDYGTYQSKGEV
ncbi:Ger(x)C family spore germination C-terminal domain-containing protein [Bacillus sp. MRMR6]|uniref:Ger(x)C family spore germination protein n=1 Tax=Bacillus sp. MRMR6 TaxID=1928617 RepID=UPI0009520BEF|nr:Ger(x)C family spore germination C-terminal domain-containing protein [Bacillus sp. MRMR6]OLS35272.1 hypothetical protein BTR25_20030 [Bacillus sp. MRMR6]